MEQQDTMLMFVTEAETKHVISAENSDILPACAKLRIQMQVVANHNISNLDQVIVISKFNNMSTPPLLQNKQKNLQMMTYMYFKYVINERHIQY